MLDASLELADEARRRGRWAGFREGLAEAADILRSGLALRLEAARIAAATSWEESASGWGQDLRFALRTLLRSPAFTAVAVGTLALGLGADTAMFSLVDGVLLRPPPYERPDELVLIWNTRPGSTERIPVAGPDVAALQAGVDRLASVAFSIRGVDGALDSDAGDAAHPVRIASVTSGFFDVLGAPAALGRTFEPADGAGGADVGGEGSAPSVVLADGVWRRAFAADPGVVGRTVRVNGFPARVVGVMPPGFRLALPPDAGVMTDVDVWVPLTVPLTAFHREPERLLDQDSDNTGVAVGRLATGASVVEAQEQADRVAQALRAELPAYAAAGLGFSVRPLHTDATAHARPVLLALLTGAAGVLLVACLNLATLLLARGTAREREFAVRACLGAGRVRLLRQLAVEGAVLGAGGFVAALGVATLLLGAVPRIVPPGLAPAGGVTLSGRAFVFGAVVAGVAVLLFAVLPGIRATGTEARSAVGSRVVRGGPRRSGARRALVGGQVALSLALALGAVLLLRTVSALDAVRPGFDADGALTFSVSLRVPDTYRSPGDRATFMAELSRGLSAHPEVQAVGLVGGLPLSGDRWTQPYGLPGQPETEWRENRADFRVVSSGYFDAMGTRILEGRVFTPEEDLSETERVVVIDERLAGRLTPGGGSLLDRPIGLPLDGRAVEARVVGVVEHVRHERLDADGREAVYVPYRQEASRDVSFVVRTTGDPATLAAGVREAVRALDPRIPVHDLGTLRSYVDEAMAPRRFALALLAGFALLALLCTAVGLYGVVAHEVGRRTRDIGVRLAVGAEPPSVVRHLLGSGVRVVASGLVVGALLAVPVASALRGLVFGVGPADPVAWGAALALVGGVAGLATWLPARRAAELSPTEALRAE